MSQWTDGLPTGYLDECDRDYSRPRLRGSRSFKGFIDQALDWLEANNPPHYRFVCLWLTSITEDDLGDANANVTASNGVCCFDTETAATKSARSIAGTLVHESMHCYLKQNRLAHRLGHQEEEDICDRAKAAAIGSSSGDYSSYGTTVIVVRI